MLILQNMSRLNRWMPEAWNPAAMFNGFMAIIWAWFTRAGISYIVTVFPGLDCSHPSMALLYAVSKGPYTDRSSSWRRWEVCGGMVSKTTSWDLAVFTTFKEMCVSWLSRIERIFFSGEHLVSLVMWFKYSTNTSSFIQPLRVALPMHCVGPPLMKWSL